MSLISFTPLQDGVTGVNAAATNNPLNTIFNDYNGNITDANIAANATIAGSKISFASTSVPYKFMAYRNASLSATSNAVIVLDTEAYDTGTNFSVSTGLFTAPTPGFYNFSGVVSFNAGGSPLIFAVGLKKNSAEYIRGEQSSFGDSAAHSLTFPDTAIQLAANDTIGLYFASSNSGTTVFNVGSTPISTWFSGCFASA